MSVSVSNVDAFAALRATVDDMTRRGSITRVAGVKPELQRRLPDFSEHRLGYGSFGVFVEAAAKEGVVRIARDEDGWKRVLAVDGPPDETSDRLRSDIWRAFTRWGDGWVRCWDRATARAVQFPVAPRDHEPDDQRMVRAALEESSGSVIPIEPVPMDQQKRWMAEFIADLGTHPLVGPLNAALVDDRPFRTFSAVLQADQTLRKRYNRFKYAHVLGAVRKWAAENSVDLDAVDHDASVPRPSALVDAALPEGRAASTATGGSDLLRAALHRAIDEMPPEDLRRLSIPVGYILDAVR